MMKAMILVLGVLWSSWTMAQQVSFKSTDGGIVSALYYPASDKSVVLAHGAIFNKESWQDLTEKLVANKISVLAIDFRGYGNSTAGNHSNALYEDILGAVAYLSQLPNIKTISVLGASMGGVAAAKASVASKVGEIDKLILLSPAGVNQPDKLKGQLLFIASKDEGLAKKVETWYQQAPQSKQLQWIEGNAHAQHIFKTTQKDNLTKIIIDFLSH